MDNGSTPVEPQPEPAASPAIALPSPFSRLRARGLIVQAFFAATLAAAAAKLLFGPHGLSQSSPADDSLTFAFFYLGVGIVLLVRMHGARLDIERVFGAPPTAATLPLTVVAIPLGVLSLAGFWILFLPISFLAPEFVRRHALDSPATHAPDTIAAWVAQVAIAAVVAPVLEELFFRGLLLQRWAYRFGTGPAVIGSSLVFAVCHVELFGHFVFAVAMCALYLRTRSLWFPILAHALNNFVALVFALPDVIAPDPANNTMTVAKLQSEWWVGLILLVVGLSLLEVYRRRYWGDIDVGSLLRGPVPYSADGIQLTANG